MPRSGGFYVLRSSAGAGKTHALTKHWLEHALATDDPGAYGRILALTFTNKAADELKDRVLKRLKALAADGELDGATVDIRDHLVATAGLDRATIKRRSAAVFTHVLHHWGEFAISTIDAFTRRLVKPFARDLQLDGDLEMSTDQPDFRRRAVDRLLAEAGQDPELTELLTRVSFNLIDDEERWRPDALLTELSAELDKGSTYARMEALRSADLHELLRVEGALRERTRKFRDHLRGLGKGALRALDEAGIEEGDLAYGKTGVLSFFRKLERFDVQLEPMGVNAQRTVEGGKWWSGKADDHAKAAIERLRPQLEAVVHEVNGLREQCREHAIRSAVRTGLLPTATLHAIDQRLEELKREEGVAFFGDLTRKAAGELGAEPPDFLFERIGERWLHLMIDEFQDTALLQWTALLPLVVNILGNGGSVRLVGDAKQAIYRWRDGEARLFARFPELFGKEDRPDGDQQERALMEHSKPIPVLADNRRSGSAIVGFNNMLFDRLKSLLPERMRPMYDAHEQVAYRKDPGYVRLEVVMKEASAALSVTKEASAPLGATNEDAEAGDEAGVLVKRTVAIAQECIADGFAPGDIAVLVRTKNQAADLASHFARQRIAVFSNDGQLLGNDPGVALLIDLLRWLHSGEAEASARAVQRMVLLQVPGLSAGALLDPVHALRLWSRAHPLVGPHVPLDRLLVDLMAATTDAAGRTLLDPTADPYLMTLLDEAHTFTARNGSGIAGFLRHWEKAGEQRAVRTPAGNNAVNLVTVHKSKGLEFPVVIVHNACMTTRGRDRVWIDPRIVIPEVPAALVPFASLVDQPVKEIEENAELMRLDELDLLYVACTRAEQRLYALVPGVKKISPEKRANDPFTSALLDLIEGEGRHGIFTTGEAGAPWPRYSKGVAIAPLEHAGAIADPIVPAIRNSAPDGWNADDPDPLRAFGTNVHAILARVRTVDDLPTAIREESRVGRLSEAEAARIQDWLGALLTSVEVAPYFQAANEVITEATLIDVHGRAHRPDRIVRMNGGLVVIDLKTGAEREHHRDQVRAYMRIVGEVEKTSVRGYLFYLREKKIDPVEVIHA